MKKMNLVKMPVWIIVVIHTCHFGSGKCSKELIFVTSVYDFRLRRWSMASPYVRMTIISLQLLFWTGTHVSAFETCINLGFTAHIARSITYLCRIQVILCIIKLTFQESFTRFTWELVLTRKRNEYHIVQRCYFTTVLPITFVAVITSTYRLILQSTIAISSLYVFILVTAISRSWTFVVYLVGRSDYKITFVFRVKA